MNTVAVAKDGERAVHERGSRVPAMVALAQDVADASRGWRSWLALALLDVKHKYRRSVLGPLWITISMAVLIAGVGTLYSVLFRLDLKQYLPYVALGDIVWIYMSTMIQEGCTAFTGSENLIRAMRLPIMTHVMRLVTRTFIIFLHGAIAYLPFAIYLGESPQAIWLMSLVGIGAIVLFSIPVTAVCGLLSARFRDLQPAIANIMQLAFFLTPVIWKADMLGNKRWVADINPIYHFIELVRAPMMGHMPSAVSYWFVAGAILAAYLVAAPFVARNRHKVPYWV